MKKILPFLLFFIFLGASVWGEDYIWTGTGDGESWNDSDNWEDSSNNTGNGFPGENNTGDTAEIGSGYTVKLNTAIDHALTSLTINGGTLTIDSAGSLTTTNITIDDDAEITGNITLDNADVLLFSTTPNTTDGADLSIAVGVTLNLGSYGIILIGDLVNNGTLKAASLIVTGDSTIDGDITTSGDQSYDGAVTITSTRTLKSTGGTITTTGLVTASAGVTIDASGEIEIGSGGITADTGTTGVIKLESGGDITVSGAVIGHQLLAIAASGSVTVGVVTIDSSNTVSEGLTAAIYIKANNFYAYGGANSIKPGGTGGQMCLNLPGTWTDSDHAVDGAEHARWHLHIPPAGKILYSFTEDEDGDGRLDRIRVQTDTTVLNGNFSSFTVSVFGYSIDISKGTNGFALVSGHNDSFYIYLIPKSELDGGNTPQWSVISNGSLKDSGNTSPVGDPSTDVNITPTDTIPPRIAYTLTLPGHPQTYVQMSEPVNSTAATFEDETNNVLVASPIGSHGYLLNLDNSIYVDDLVKSNINGSLAIGYFSIKDMVDHSTAPATIDGVAPKYPVNWGYTTYSTGPNAFVPPHHLIDNRAPPLSVIVHTAPAVPIIRRVTDVLVSMPPVPTPPDNYFAWPVFAKNEKGTIGIFDGTASLEAGESTIELQAQRNPTLASTLRLFYKITVRGNSNALWQPFSSQYYFAPYGADAMLNGTGVSPNLFNYSFPDIDIGDRVEFYFYIGSGTPSTDQFIARLDIKSGAAIPSNWYDLVRPFCFDVRGVSRQRGGVSIRNNVINSDAREITTIHLELARPGRVTIQLYTLEGTLVKSLMRNEYREAGELDVEWNGTNNSDRPVARGMYFVRVVGPDIDEIRKIMVIR